MVESGRLESGYPGYSGIGGSNPPLSTSHSCRSTCGSVRVGTGLHSGNYMKKKLICLLMVLTGTSLKAMVFDNRFLPLLLKPHTRLWDAPSWIRIQPFFMFADRAFSDGERLNIPDLDGHYNEVSIARGLVKRGLPDPLRSELRLRESIPWTRKGRIDAQGLAFMYEQALGCYVSVGFNTFFAHVTSRHDFLFREGDLHLNEGDRNYLFAVKEQMHNELGVTPPLYSHTGLGDIDLYLRLGNRWEYTCKFRRIDTALRLGLIVPTASETPINNPAAVPLGGEKHWGAYLGFEGEFEFKEDLIGGLQLRASKRFRRTSIRRMPFGDEPSHYGAVVGPLEVDPGWTFVFNPYASFEGLREGFGLKAQYTLTSHLEDSFCDKRSEEFKERIKAELRPLKERSSWGSEYVTIGAFYDFGKVWEGTDGYWRLYPKISAYWDIPVNWLVSKRAAKTNSVSLMVELDF